MKQNHDCMRAILKYVEENQDYKGKTLEVVKSEDILSSPLVSEYEEKDILYSIKHLGIYGLLDVKERAYIHNKVEYDIIDLMPAGHDFINNTKGPAKWEEVKKKAARIGAFAFDAVIKLSAELIYKSIKGQQNG